MSYHGCGVIRSFFQCHIPQHKVTLVRSHVFEANMVFVWLLNSNGSDVFLSLSATKKVRYFVVPISTRQKERKKKPFENPNPWSILVAGMPSPGWHYLFWVRESQIKPSFGRSHAVTIWALSVWWNGGDDRSSNMFSMLRMFPLFRP